MNDSFNQQNQETQDSTSFCADKKKAVESHKNKISFFKKYGSFLFFAVGLCLLSASFLYVFIALKTEDNHPSSVLQGNSVILSKEEVDTADVVDRVSPSVVSIVSQKSKQNFLFGGAKVSQAGTGVIVSDDGYILTNKHVIGGGVNFLIVTSDGNEYNDVEVVGSDPLNDIAFLKIKNAKGFKAIKFGDSKKIKIGQKVIAIGNALGQYQNTVTTGIISGVNRSLTAKDEGNEEEVNLSDLIQTDAAINHGNSGGPLLDSAGNMIGINTAIASGSQGLGFSIPVSAIKGMVNGLLKHGVVKRGFLGVQYVPINKQLQKYYKLPVDHGALVYSDDKEPILKGTAAEKLGIRQGDIITKINDVEIGQFGSMSSLISELTPGDKVKITFLQDNKEKSETIQLGEYKE